MTSPELIDLRVWTFKDGLLSRVAHDLCIRARDAALQALPDDPERLLVTLSVASFEVLGQAHGERVTPLRPKDHAEIARNLQSAKVLDAARHPTIRVRVRPPAVLESPARADAEIELQGRRIPVQLVSTRADDGVTWTGALELTHRQLGLTPFKAMLGALKLQERLRVTWTVRHPNP